MSFSSPILAQYWTSYNYHITGKLTNYLEFITKGYDCTDKKNILEESRAYFPLFVASNQDSESALCGIKSNNGSLCLMGCDRKSNRKYPGDYRIIYRYS